MSLWTKALLGIAALAAVVMLVMNGPRPSPQSPAAGLASAAAPAAARGFKVVAADIDDWKSVFATVHSRDRIEARVRLPGTVTELKVDEGRQVVAGEVLATVADQKIALRLGALDAQIVGARSRTETARAEMERSAELLQRRVAPQARYDQAKSAYDTALNQQKSLHAERNVLLRQIEEGQVLSPANGRVLRVPITVGSVVMAGESIATIAANAFLLRLELPERHARHLKVGDPVRVGTGALSAEAAATGKGRIVQVYPELQAGRVIADVEADGLGNYFVGERVRVWISAGKRRALLVPAALPYTRFGMDYVRLAPTQGPPQEVVVQLGRAVEMSDGTSGVEVLSGLAASDVVIAP